MYDTSYQFFSIPADCQDAVKYRQHDTAGNKCEVTDRITTKFQLDAGNGRHRFQCGYAGIESNKKILCKTGFFFWNLNYIWIKHKM
jgi:hypothetical protein